MSRLRKYSTIIASVAAVFVLTVFAVRAATEDELRQKIDAKNQEIRKLEEEIKQYQGSIAQTSAAARTLRNTINGLNQEIKTLNSQLKLTQTKISKKELEIDSLSGSIDDALRSLAQQQQALQAMLRQLNEIETKNPLEILMDYRTLSAFFDAIEKNKMLESSVRDLYEQLQTTKQQLESQRSDAESARKQLVALKTDLSDQRAIEEDQKAEKAQLLSVTKNQEAQYQKLLKDREKKRLAVEKEIDAIEDELRRLIDVNTIPSRGKGILLWPVANPVITQGFGLTSFSVATDVYKNNRHNGVDFKASIGTPVYAAEDGIVKDTGDTDIICRGGSYGRWVVIEHNNNLSTLYAHFSRSRVVAGQRVSRGDIIGLSGNTGYSTGPHVHFTVYASNTFRMARTNNCGLIPAGGYIDPLDYL